MQELKYEDGFLIYGDKAEYVGYYTLIAVLIKDFKQKLEGVPLDGTVMPKIAETLHRDLEIEMYGKIIKGILNGEQVSEQWINVNNAVFIAKKYMAKVESNFSA